MTYLSMMHEARQEVYSDIESDSTISEDDDDEEVDLDIGKLAGFLIVIQ